MRSVAIVQARLGSTRLPGKVLMDLGGKTMLARVAARAVAVPGIDAVVLAVPDDAKNTALREAAARLPGVSVFAGHESDVLDRYYRAAVSARADFVLRITADCPLIDPEIAGRVLAALRAENAGFASNNEPPTFPHGLDCEAFPFSSLEAAWRESKLPREREHVGPFMRSRPERFKPARVVHSSDLHHLRWTVDDAGDMEFARAVFARLGPRGDAAGLDEILAIAPRRAEAS